MILTAAEILLPSVVLAIYCAVAQVHAEQRWAAEPLNQPFWAAVLVFFSIADALFLAAALLALLHYAFGATPGFAGLLVEAGRWLLGMGLLCAGMVHLAAWRRHWRRFHSAPSARLGDLFRGG